MKYRACVASGHCERRPRAGATDDANHGAISRPTVAGR